MNKWVKRIVARLFGFSQLRSMIPENTLNLLEMGMTFIDLIELRKF